MPLFSRSLILSIAFACALGASAQAQVVIEGAPRGASDIVSAYLDEAGQECEPGTKVRREPIMETVRTALDALGYFGASIHLEVVSDGNCVLTLAIAQRARVSGWAIEFNDRPSESDAVAEARALAFAPGTEFDPQQYNKIKQRFISTLTDAGYLDAEFTETEVSVDTEENTATIRWQVTAGTRYVIAPLMVEQSILSDSLVRKFLQFRQGDPFSQHDVLASYDSLVESDYFRAVRVEPSFDQRADGRIPVTVAAVAAERWSYLAGPGFATDTGPRLRAEANARYLNSAGHRLGFSSMVSPVAGNLKGEYRWPYGDPRHEWYSLVGRFNYEDTDTAHSDTAGIGVHRTRRWSRRWAHTAYVDYAVEKFDISDQEGRSQLLLLGNNLTYTSTIDAARPRSGRRVSFDVRGGTRAILSDNDVIQLRVQAKQILPFLGRSRLLLRAEAGASWQDDFEALPASLRFFTGGDKSVRGHALDSLGPEDETGDVVGGDRLLVGSIELDVPVRKNWSMALFTDIGSAYVERPNFSQSIGIGLRWYSPLGPIRIDLAHPLQDSDQAIRFHVSLGPDI